LLRERVFKEKGEIEKELDEREREKTFLREETKKTQPIKNVKTGNARKLLIFSIESFLLRMPGVEKKKKKPAGGFFLFHLSFFFSTFFFFFFLLMLFFCF
jgi:hypothetical protein